MPQVGKIEEKDVDSLLELIGEELSTEELEDLEKQRRQLEKVEAEQRPMAPVMKAMTIKILQGFYMLFNQTMDYIPKGRD